MKGGLGYDDDDGDRGEDNRKRRTTETIVVRGAIQIRELRIRHGWHDFSEPYVSTHTWVLKNYRLNKKRTRRVEKKTSETKETNLRNTKRRYMFAPTRETKVH